MEHQYVGALPSVWLDTNVVLELYSHGDLFKEADDPAKLEQRRVRMQGSLWLAMAFAKAGAVTVQYKGESSRNLLRLAPPRTDVGSWTSAIIWVLEEGGVFEGWRALVSENDADPELNNPARDRLIIDLCLADNLVYVTRDAANRERARERGVDAGSPESFAARVISWEEARTMFLERLSVAIDRYVSNDSDPRRGTRDEREAVCRALRNTYERIWSAKEPRAGNS